MRGLRIITNMHCNLRCEWCYQKDKSYKNLDIDKIDQTIRESNSIEGSKFDYCTIMGGESTLVSNLDEIIKIGCGIEE